MHEVTTAMQKESAEQSLKSGSGHDPKEMHLIGETDGKTAFFCFRSHIYLAS
jgi:hypothetical protein